MCAFFSKIGQKSHTLIRGTEVFEDVCEVHKEKFFQNWWQDSDCFKCFELFCFTVKSGDIYFPFCMFAVAFWKKNNKNTTSPKFFWKTWIILGQPKKVLFATGKFCFFWSSCRCKVLIKDGPKEATWTLPNCVVIWETMVHVI